MKSRDRNRRILLDELLPKYDLGSKSYDPLRRPSRIRYEAYLGIFISPNLGKK